MLLFQLGIDPFKIIRDLESVKTGAHQHHTYHAPKGKLVLHNCGNRIAGGIDQKTSGNVSKIVIESQKIGFIITVKNARVPARKTEWNLRLFKIGVQI